MGWDGHVGLDWLDWVTALVWGDVDDGQIVVWGDDGDGWSDDGWLLAARHPESLEHLESLERGNCRD